METSNVLVLSAYTQNYKSKGFRNLVAVENKCFSPAKRADKHMKNLQDEANCLVEMSEKGQ